MKKALFSLMLAGCIASAQPKVTEPETSNSNQSDVTFNANANANEFLVESTKVEDFYLDALETVKQNFDVQSYIKENPMGKLGTYEVSFRTPKGVMEAKFDAEGNMKGSFQKFKNIPLPYEIRNQIYPEYLGWDLVKTSFVAKGKQDRLTNCYYKVQLKKGKKKKNIKIDANPDAIQAVASN